MYTHLVLVNMTSKAFNTERNAWDKITTTCNFNHYHARGRTVNKICTHQHRH